MMTPMARRDQVMLMDYSLTRVITPVCCSEAVMAATVVVVAVAVAVAAVAVAV